MLIQDDLVNKLSLYLPQNAIIYLSSDSNRVILWMINKFLQNKSFKLVKHSEVINNVDNHFPQNVLTNLLTADGLNYNTENVKSENQQNQESKESKEEKNNEGENEGEDEGEENDDEDDEDEEDGNENEQDQEDENENDDEISAREMIKLYDEYWIPYNPLVSEFIIIMIIIKIICNCVINLG